MSVIPQRTLVLVKDIPFQDKYKLSHTQMDLMAYFVNLSFWAINVDNYNRINYNPKQRV
jgi:hypothetical protein